MRKFKESSTGVVENFMTHKQVSDSLTNLYRNK